MNRLPRIAYVVATLSVVTAFGPGGAPARAAGSPIGFLCNASEDTDGTPQQGTRVVDVYAGPLVVTDADGVTPARGTLVCRVGIMTDWSPDHTDAGIDFAGRGTGVLTAGPARIRVAGGSSWPVFECTTFVDDKDGVTSYWDDWTGEWSADPATPCSYAQGNDDPEPPTLDSFVCPLLAVAFPPEGDVPLIWDCPPYGDVDLLPVVVPVPAACADGIDDDADGLADYPADPGCASATDVDEHSFAACDDGADNDGDRASDYPRDPGCASATDTDERGTAQCDDGLDNDGDGARDYVLDPGCMSPGDDSEG